jgi:hypothetical protein
LNLPQTNFNSMRQYSIHIKQPTTEVVSVSETNRRISIKH